MRKVILKSFSNTLLLLNRIILWHFKYYFLNSFFPLACGVYVTNKCNLKCEMCNVWGETEKHTLSLKLNKLIIEELSRIGCYYYSFSGGEPLLVEDIVERIAFAKSKLPYVHMVSNGLLLDKNIAKNLATTNLSEISLSIDGTQAYHDKIRGVSGSFRKVIEALDNLKTFAPKIRIVVNTIISPENISDIYEVVELVEKQGLFHKFQPLNKHPKFKGQKVTTDKWGYSKVEVFELNKFINYIKKKKNIVNSSYFLSQIPNFFTRNVNQGIFDDVCKFGFHHCEIKEDGTLFPCLLGMGWQGGFSLGEDLKGVIKSKAYREKVNSLKGCNLCKNNMYICYLEPRNCFPLKNFIKYNIFQK